LNAENIILIKINYNQKKGVRKSNNTCTLLCGPWCPCSPDQSHPYWHLNIPKTCPCPADISDPQRFRDWQTQQHRNDTTHISCPILPHWCDSKKKKLLYLIHRIYTSLKVQAFPPANSQKEVWKFLGFLLLLCLAPQFFCNRSSTIR